LGVDLGKARAWHKKEIPKRYHDGGLGEYGMRVHKLGSPPEKKKGLSFARRETFSSEGGKKLHS